ncbi:hypothetical protein ACPTI5_14250, partial [Enterococcus faecium]
PVQDFIVAIGGLTAAFGILLPAILAVSYLFGPMMLIIGGIIAVIEGVIVAIKNWGAISDWFSGLWKKFTDWLGDTWES